MPLDWRTAYTRQALSEYAIFVRLNRENVPACHQLHYLQMVTEKLAKGFLTKPGATHFPNTHNAFTQFVIAAVHLREIMAATGFTRKDQFRAYMNGLRHTAQMIEDLSPEGGDHPNPEYPWESAGQIQVPSEYEFNNLDFKSASMTKLLKFVSDCAAVARTSI